MDVYLYNRDQEPIMYRAKSYIRGFVELQECVTCDNIEIGFTITVAMRYGGRTSTYRIVAIDDKTALAVQVD